ncbi:hypothetical protein HYPSUDRAFT_34872 [Hypholoma sublateritium FD-334 SS-4]|uniref:Uncharacterized protein n=1 Tax=Hypholoma sublateritium (strain FD-334 SS-4) TaxID=945553 RepID=A0A0D2LJD0_HYPSF|nr:hypothetical protein HYPSUDRAFT_34872 [Hypholoma sublateritium FD-334 SS-4]
MLLIRWAPLLRFLLFHVLEIIVLISVCTNCTSMPIQVSSDPALCIHAHGQSITLDGFY